MPAVRTQSWLQNYEDDNIADNPVHPTVADKLIGPPHRPATACKVHRNL